MSCFDIYLQEKPDCHLKILFKDDQSSRRDKIMKKIQKKYKECQEKLWAESTLNCTTKANKNKSLIFWTKSLFVIWYCVFIFIFIFILHLLSNHYFIISWLMAKNYIYCNVFFLCFILGLFCLLPLLPLLPSLCFCFFDMLLS